MKAKIFNIVDVSAIPSELQSRLKKIDTTIESALLSNNTSRYVLNLDMEKPDNIKCCLESIGATRLALSEIDKALSDCAEMLQGFYDFVKKKSEEEEKTRLVQKALDSKQKQQDFGDYHDDHAHHGHENCDVVHEAPKQPMTKELIHKLAEMNDANEG